MVLHAVRRSARTRVQAANAMAATGLGGFILCCVAVMP